MQEAESLVGQLLAETYRLERLLAKGGMGAVYVARHLRTGGYCAVKLLYRQLAADEEIYRRFQDEARIISALRHPHIVHVSDLNQTAEGTPFIVMELLEGEDLEVRLQRLGRLPVADVLSLARHVGSAIQAAHNQGVVHRDLKPSNLFLARHEVGGRHSETAKVIDFGLSKIPKPRERTTRNMMLLGTPRYMAPEAAEGRNADIDGRADQFSLAVVLYRALCGQAPFRSEGVVELLQEVIESEPLPVAQMVPGLPEHISAALQKAMSKDRERRFDTMMDFVEALEGNTRHSRRNLHRVPPSRATPTRQWDRALSHPPSLRRERTLASPHGLRLRWRSNLAAAVLGAAVCGVVGAVVVEHFSLAPRHGAAASLASPHPAAVQSPAAPPRPAAAPAAQAAAPAAQTPATAAAPATPPRRRDAVPPGFVDARLRAAAEARERGDCRRALEESIKALSVAPHSEAALLARWDDCGAGQVPLSRPFPDEKRHHHGPMLPGYPLLRVKKHDPQRAAPDSPGMLLFQARLSFADGHYARALSLAHSVIGIEKATAGQALRLLCAAACRLGRSDDLCERLDEPSRLSVTQACQVATAPE